eukprot:38771-Hanusia_phi.AAC.5
MAGESGGTEQNPARDAGREDAEDLRSLDRRMSRALLLQSVSRGISSRVVQQCMLRSYEEEHRLVHENAILTSEIEETKRKLQTENLWRSQIKEIQGRMMMYNEVMDRRCSGLEESAERISAQLRLLSDYISKVTSENSMITIQNYKLKQEVESYQLKLQNLETRASQAEDELRQAVMGGEQLRVYKLEIESLLRDVEHKDDRISRLRQALQVKEVEILATRQESLAAVKQCKSLSEALEALRLDHLAASSLQEKMHELQARELLLGSQVATLTTCVSELKVQVTLAEETAASRGREAVELRTKLARTEEKVKEKEIHAEEARSRWEEDRRREMEFQIGAERRVEEMRKIGVEVAELRRIRRELEERLSSSFQEKQTLEERCQVSLRLLADVTEKLRTITSDKAELVEIQARLEEQLCEVSQALTEQMRRREEEVGRLTGLLTDAQVKLQRTQTASESGAAMSAAREQALLQKQEEVATFARKLEVALVSSARAEGVAAAEMASARNLRQEVQRLREAVEVISQARDEEARSVELERQRNRLLLTELRQSEDALEVCQQEVSGRQAAEEVSKACQQQLARYQQEINELLAESQLLETTKKKLSGACCSASCLSANTVEDATAKIEEMQRANSEMRAGVRETRERLKATEKQLQEVYEASKKQNLEVTRMQELVSRLRDSEKKKDKETSAQAIRMQQLTTKMGELSMRLKTSESALRKETSEKIMWMKEAKEMEKRTKEMEKKLAEEQEKTKREMSVMDIEMRKTQLRLEHSLLSSNIKPHKAT